MVVTTFNSPDYLRWVVESVLWQTKLPDEIIVADDGSDVGTTLVVDSLKQTSRIPLIHSFLPDGGFRLARSRNLAASKAIGDWLMFLDGDCILPPYFIERQLSVAKPANLVFCGRKLATRQQTIEITRSAPCLSKVKSAFTGRKFLRLYMGSFRRIPRRNWTHARGFFLGLSRVSFEQIGGFDESYESWGLEDSDFVLRAQRHGLQLTDARYLISVLHMYHEEAPKGEKSQNVSQFENLISETSRVSPRRSILKANPR